MPAGVCLPVVTAVSGPAMTGDGSGDLGSWTVPQVPGREGPGGTYRHRTGMEQTQDALGRLAGELLDVGRREADLEIRLRKIP